MTTFNQSTFLQNWRQYFQNSHLAEFYGPVPYQNLMDRADCESATPPALVGQTTNALTACTFAQSGAQHHAGTNSYLLTKTVGVGTLATAYLGASTGFNGLKATMYTFSLWMYVPASGFTSGQPFISVGYIPYTNTGTVEAKTVWQGPTATWVQLTASILVPANAVGIFAYVGVVAAGGLFTLYVDDLQFNDLFNTTMLPGATLSIYDGRQPQSADFPLYSGTNLCATYTFPADSFSVVSPVSGIQVLDPMPTAIALVSSTATWARVTNAAGSVLFDCAVGNADDQDDLVLSLNPFVVGHALTISSGKPRPFVAVPSFGNSVGFSW